MRAAARHSFETSLKLSALSASPAVNMALRMPKVPRPTVGGTFGIKDALKSAEAETSGPTHRPAWARTLIDLPLSAGVMGIGYGVGRLAADALVTQIAHDPKALKGLPAAVGITGALAALGMRGVQGHMARRRQQAVT